ncbi:hypothetical protein [Pseudonocardia nigra]|uniref:hypothetical protein n=1 Tax=Pseudonocardia nigra TaxID=1921578 RepID=UPI001C5ED4A1|nr:hypothetical protein [Pseudonocardia nigra]
MLITLLSAKGSPGVTTAALALAAEWPYTAVMIDADPSGGDVAAGLGRGSWPPASTLIGLAVEARHTPVEAALRRLVVRPAAHCPLTLAGLTTPEQSAALPWQQLAVGFRAISDADLLCDGGRYTPSDGVASLLHASDHVVLVTRSALPPVRAVARLVPVLRDEVLAADCLLSILVVGGGRPYAASDIATNCGAALLGELPLDPRAAFVWSEGQSPRRGFGRSQLQRAARDIAARLASDQPAMAAEGLR